MQAKAAVYSVISLNVPFKLSIHAVSQAPLAICRGVSMNIMVVDDEPSVLQRMEQILTAIDIKAQVYYFLSAEASLEHAAEYKVDVVFLDIEMSSMDSIFFAKKLKEIHRDINIIFSVGNAACCIDAFYVRASGCILKPVDPESVERELKNLRNPVKVQEADIRIQCFGNFEIFVDGQPLAFGRPRAKEILAYLVDRKGANVTKKELAAVIWEDEIYSHSIQSHLFVLMTDLVKTLEDAGASGLILKKRGQYSVDTSKFKCDYYSYEKGEAWGMNSYCGEYMTDYSWGEYKVEFLNKLKQ